MYYKQTIINGLWYFKTSINGAWQLSHRPSNRTRSEPTTIDNGTEHKKYTFSTKNPFVSVRMLGRQLQKAVQREDYLEAAELRDKINAYK